MPKLLILFQMHHSSKSCTRGEGSEIQSGKKYTDGTPDAFHPRTGTLFASLRKRLNETRGPLISHRIRAHPPLCRTVLQIIKSLFNFCLVLVCSQSKVSFCNDSKYCTSWTSWTQGSLMSQILVESKRCLPCSATLKLMLHTGMPWMRLREAPKGPFVNCNIHQWDGGCNWQSLNS